MELLPKFNRRLLGTKEVAVPVEEPYSKDFKKGEIRIL